MSKKITGDAEFWVTQGKIKPMVGKPITIITSRPIGELIKINRVGILVEQPLLEGFKRYLEKAGNQQAAKDLGVSDKAISRARRGLGLPDNRGHYPR